MRAGQDELADRLWGVVPVGRGRPIISSFFLDEETQLEGRLGVPISEPTMALVEEARGLLGPGHLATAPSAGPDSATVGRDQPALDGARELGGLRFGDCEIDFDMRELRRGGERTHVEPQVYDLLLFLLERRGTVVSKEDILDGVWGDRFVSESALTSRIKSARRAMGDDGRTQRIIRTVHGHGYSFVAEVE